MVRSKNKTQPTAQSVDAFLATVEPAHRREDGLILLETFSRVTDMKPQMWGPSIIGFGRYHFKYDSGREGEHLITGFSPRKTALTLYIMPGYRDLSPMLERLGKHKIGKSCLYINKLDDIDMSVVEEIICYGLDYMKATYQTWDE